MNNCIGKGEIEQLNQKNLDVIFSSILSLLHHTVTL